MATHWVLAVEAAYVAAATKPIAPASDGNDTRAFAAAAAVASRFLAIGTPHSIGLVGGTDGERAAHLDAHATWFAPREIRVAGGSLPTHATAAVRHATIAEALACDIVCVLAHDGAIARTSIRSGTQLNLAPGIAIDDALRTFAIVVPESGAPMTLARIAAGFDDGRQLDEITVFVAQDLGVAKTALVTVLEG